MWWDVSFWKCSAVIISAIPWLYEAMKYFSRRTPGSYNEIPKASTTSAKYEILMFRDEQFECRPHCHRRIECEKKNCAYKYLSRMCSILGNAASSLDVCMYFITCKDIIGAILLASRRGVHVRIITDGNIMDFGSQLNILEQYGIPLQKVKSSYNMHHKFAVVDNKVLLEGSANWTIQAFSGNWENVIITSDPHVVQTFAAIFSEFWDSLQDKEKED